MSNINKIENSNKNLNGLCFVIVNILQNLIENMEDSTQRFINTKQFKANQTKITLNS